MPIQILPPKQREQSWGEILGTGLGQGLNSLIKHKVDEAGRANNLKRFQGMGLTPQAAEILNYVQEVDPAKFTQVLQGFGPNAYAQPHQYQPEEYVNEQIQTPGGENISVQKEIPVKSGGPLFEDKEAKKRAHEEQKLINKEVYPFIKDVQQKSKGAKENDLRLNRMEKLIESGKLNNPTFASLLKTLKHGIWGLGIDLTHLLEPESQEFEKLSNDFIKNAKDVFGGRLTDQDLKAFLATVPTLSQTNQGKKAVIHNLKLFNKAAELREVAARKLLTKYGNRPPLDFEAQVEDLIKPELDNISQSFEKGVSKGAARTSSALGDVAGAIGQTFLGND